MPEFRYAASHPKTCFDCVGRASAIDEVDLRVSKADAHIRAVLRLADQKISFNAEAPQYCAGRLSRIDMTATQVVPLFCPPQRAVLKQLNSALAKLGVAAGRSPSRCASLHEIDQMAQHREDMNRALASESVLIPHPACVTSAPSRRSTRSSTPGVDEVEVIFPGRFGAFSANSAVTLESSP